MAIQPYLKLYRPAAKGVCLEWFFPGDGTGSREFAEWMYINAPKSTGWFHQGGSSDREGGWHLFEFWQYEADPEKVAKLANEAAARFGKELIVEL